MKARTPAGADGGHDEIRRGELLLESGDRDAESWQVESAEASYLEALAVFDVALGLDPESFPARMGRGRALLACARLDHKLMSRSLVQSRLAVVRAVPGEDVRAPDPAAERRWARIVVARYERAAEAFEAALRLRAGVEASIALSEAREAQGVTHASRGPGHEREALACLSRALAALAGAVEPAPRPDLLDRKAVLLRLIGDIYGRLSEWDEAAAHYRDASAALDAVLQIVPDHPDARSTKASVLATAADLETRLPSPAWSPRLPRDPAETLRRHREALQAFDAALEAGADRAWTLASKADELLRLGDLERALSRRRAALDCYRQAVRLFDEVIAERSERRSRRGRALERAGDVARELGRTGEAVWSYERGIGDLRDAAARSAWSGGYDDFALGAMLLHLGALYLETSRPGDARDALEEARRVLVATTGITDGDKLVRDRLLAQGASLLRRI
ncbi:MAG TPA: hypothetical protein VKL22_07945 [Actinomycetota bacterium]|nr:hypothetical protein [Actinomycetota bacterium]